MGFFNKLKQMANDGAKAAQDGFANFNNRAFADATMAACALITAADGEIDPAERERVSQFIATSEKLRTFDALKLKDSYDEYCNRLSRDYELGKIALYDSIAKIKKPNEARSVVQVALLIANADGDFSDDEKEATRQIISTLNLDPADFGL